MDSHTYLIIKWLHILSSVIMVGTGFGTAFYMACANRWGNISNKAFIAKYVVWADWLFTTPTIIIQPLTGAWMMHYAGWSFEQKWLTGSIILYIFTGLCWLPVVWLQIQLRNLAQNSLEHGTPLPKAYRRYAYIWEALGYPAFLATLLIFYWMVAKPF